MITRVIVTKGIIVTSIIVARGIIIASCVIIMTTGIIIAIRVVITSGDIMPNTFVCMLIASGVILMMTKLVILVTLVKKIILDIDSEFHVIIVGLFSVDLAVVLSLL